MKSEAMSAEKKRWKWQRARILLSTHHPETIGHLIWASERYAGPVIERDKDRALAQGDNCIVVNCHEDGRPMVVDLGRIELLARSEDDFRDEVELIPFAEWLKQDDFAQQPAKENSK